MPDTVFVLGFLFLDIQHVLRPFSLFGAWTELHSGPGKSATSHDISTKWRFGVLVLLYFHKQTVIGIHFVKSNAVNSAVNYLIIYYDFWHVLLWMRCWNMTQFQMTFANHAENKCHVLLVYWYQGPWYTVLLGKQPVCWYPLMLHPSAKCHSS